MGEWAGVIIAIVSSALGGTAAAVTHYLVHGADPLTLAVLRWGIGFLCVLPIALALRVRWPRAADWVGIAALGICFFELFFVFYNVAAGRTTAARQPRALDIAVADHGGRGAAGRGALDDPQIDWRRNCDARCRGSTRPRPIGSASGRMEGRTHHGRRGVVHGVLWRLVKAFMQRSSALGFLTVGMGAGAATLILVGFGSGRLAVLSDFGLREWIAGFYLGAGGGALAFILWALGLQRTTRTRVTNTMTVNPIAAALLATQLVGEPITPNVVIGLITVFVGIWIATT